MKKITTLILLFLSVNLIAQTKATYPPKVTKITPTEWVVLKKVKETSTVPNNKTAGTAVGAGMGYWLLGGPVGIAVGALAGHTASSDSKQVTSERYVQVPVHGYYILLSDGNVFRTRQKYSVNDIVYKSSIQEE